MLKKENRLRKDREYRKIFKSTKPVYLSNLVFRVAKTNGEVSRFGFVISNKTEKLAVRRNGLRRQLRRIIEEMLPQIKPGCDVAITVKQNFPYPYQQEEIRKQIVVGLMREGLIL